MICPKCGHKMKDDMLYCEKCGEEIQFVPDFEPEIEQSINDTLSEIKINDLEGDFVIKKNRKNYNNEFNNEEFFDNLDEFDSNEYDSNSLDSGEYDDNYSDEYIDEEYLEEEYLEDDYSDADFVNDNYTEGDYVDDNYIDEDYIDDSYPENNSDNAYADEYDDEYYDEYDDEYYDDDDYDEDFLGDPFDDFEYESHLIKKFISFLKYSKLKWVILILLIALIGGGVFGALKLTEKLKTNNSVDYQTQLATEAASDGNYALAIEYMEKALALNSKDSSKKFLLSEYYFKNNEDEKALLMLWEVINEGGINSTAAYKSVINYYVENNDYVMIEKILSSCADQSILQEYGNYLALEPEFNIPEGTYEDVINIIISGDIGGTVYYTIDGSEPTMDSDIFYNPIELSELGVYTISAFYVNSYGIASDIVKKTYTIDISTPKAPNVLLDPGTYNIPMLIEVDVQNYCSVYYTTDGTLPTIFSNEYTGPIPMPIGNTHFIFIAMSQESVWGEVTEVEYNLNIDSTVDINEITQNLLNYNFVLGKAIDAEGHLIGNSTSYKYQISSAIAFNKEDDSLVLLDHGQEGEEEKSDIDKVKEIKKDDINLYYLIVELLVDNQGNTMKTGTIYLCDIETGTLFNATKDEEGFITKTDEIPPEMYTFAIVPEEPVVENTGE